MDAEIGTMGTLPFLATGTGPPLVYLGGLAPEAGVTAEQRAVAARIRAGADR